MQGEKSCPFYSLELKNFNEANCTLWNNDNGNNWPRALKQFIAFFRLVLSYRVHSSKIHSVHVSNIGIFMSLGSESNIVVLSNRRIVV